MAHNMQNQLRASGHLSLLSSVTGFRLGVSAIALALAGIGGVATAREPVAAAPGADQAEDEFQIRFRADTLVVTPVLNAVLSDHVRTVVAGEQAHFQTYTNYPAFIDRGEVRIFRAGQSPDAEPVATLSVDPAGGARWDVPGDAPEALYFTYRVLAKDGKFDETSPQELTVVSGKVAQNMDFGPKPRYPEFGSVDQAARRTIPLTGLMATVTGRADARRDLIIVSGQAVPVDAQGNFVAQQIVSRTDGAMTVSIVRDGQEIKQARQSFAAPRDDWFVVGQGELTLGRSYGTGPARAVSGDTMAEGDFATGRAAFYAKGIVGQDVRVTASADTGERLIKDLFSNIDRKDPRQLLRRLDSSQYYPTYGDDSTLVEDAPTQGRFYLRVNKDASQLVVGNFVMQATGAELAQLDRGLFGLVTVLCRSPERLELVIGDRRDDEAFRRVQAGGGADCAGQRSIA